jgi:signal recognition particle receptor subunit beta
MALFNYATRELSAKIVYYGPGLSGKTTNIEMVHRILRPEQKGRLISLPTETDRTLFFDFLPVDLGQIKGFKVRFHLYTVPGQVFYNATRRLVLQGVDGVVFVADSQAGMAQSNVDSLKNLVENLATYGKKLEDLPFVLQYNKRDLRQIMPVNDMSAQLNPRNVPVVEGIAKDGVGVSETLVTISRMVFSHLRKTLLMPGETEEHEEIGKLADVKIRESLRPEGFEPLEEISDLEEIQEVPETRGEEAVPEEPDFRGTAGAAAGGVEPLPEPPATVTGQTGPGRGLLEGLDEVEIEIPAGAPPPPAELSSRAAIVEPIPEPPSPVVEQAAPGRSLLEGLDEIEIEIPATAPQPSAETASRAAVSVETEEGAPTFLKFENPYITPEGHAVLPAVFMDPAGNIIRMRIRVSVEEQE